MKKLIAGLINQKISIKRYEDVENDNGGTSPNEVDYWNTSAEVTYLEASKRLEANQEKLKPVVIFKIRYRNDKTVIADMNIHWRGQVFSVLNAKPDYVNKEYLIIRAIAGKAPVR